MPNALTGAIPLIGWLRSFLVSAGLGLASVRPPVHLGLGHARPDGTSDGRPP